MRAKNTIVINGKVYDAISGLSAGAPDRIEKPATAASQADHHTSPRTHTTAHGAPATATHAVKKAKAVHRQTQRSQTLRRDILKQPAQPQHQSSARRKPTVGSVAQSPMISRFAAHPQPLRTHPSTHAVRPAAAAKPAVPSRPHPVHTAPAAHATPAHHVKPASLSSRELKEKLIAERLATVEHKAPHDHKPVKQGLFSRAPRVSSVIVASFAIVFLGGYLTYINMPNLSMRVAAANAGVDASFPDYRPDGYRFDGPIAYSNGEVSLTFASNTNGAGYTIEQQNSNWDSQAVLDNYVSKKSKDYLTYSEQGITIYTYEGKAAWVNGGIFYTIEGNAPLSNQQILRIASSM